MKLHKTVENYAKLWRTTKRLHKTMGKPRKTVQNYEKVSKKLRKRAARSHVKLAQLKTT